jgi:hypothetical protein
MQKHIRAQHQATKQARGRRRKTPYTVTASGQNTCSEAELWDEVLCQRFFVTGPQCRFFQIAPLVTPTINPDPDPVYFIRTQINKQIQQHQQEEERQHQTITAGHYYSELNPWLDKTRWHDYTQGHTFTELAALGYMPDPIQEPLLQLWMESIDTILDQAIQSVSHHRINAFDQARVNSFVVDAYQRPSHRPVFYQLKPLTDQRYRQIWKRLLCFVYRTAQPDQPIQLAHVLTQGQHDLLQQLVQLSHQLYENTASTITTTATTTAAIAARLPGPPLDNALQSKLSALNRACLLLCISLLDHILRRDLFESVVVGFFAILGIDEKKSIFRDAYAYTPILSGFIKISQLLVIQRAVLAVEEGIVDEPSSILNEMRERFLIHGCATPIGWALRLRTYGKKIRMRQTAVLPGHVD